MTGYHWYVLLLCAMGWMFDSMDQQIFTASRSITMRDLLPHAGAVEQTRLGSWATTLFMLGWATGGLLFGILGDKWGRAKTMALTVFLYAGCTGLSALSHNWTQFALSRLITGFGVGGEFAAGAALVADVMPTKARAQALGLLQALSAVGNVLGAGMLGIVAMWAHDSEHYSWRYLYLFGAFPALIAVFVMARMKEPQKWVAAKRAAQVSGDKSMGRISDLFTDARWRRHTLVGLGLAIAGVVGLWGIGFYSPELIDATFPQMSVQSGADMDQIFAMPLTSRSARINAMQDSANATLPLGQHTAAANKRFQDDLDAYTRLLARTAGHGEKLPRNLANLRLEPTRRTTIIGLLGKRMTPEHAAKLKSRALVMQQCGAFLGMLMFAVMATRIGRRWSFVISFIVAWASIFIVFLGFNSEGQIWYLYPLLGFCTLLPFGGYAIYFPELFPTRLRTTGTGFCYNVGRYVSSLGPLVFGSLGALFAGRFQTAGFRVAAATVASIYLLGIISALLGPETKDCALPEDEGVAAH